jgi:hypothetical protein
MTYSEKLEELHQHSIDIQKEFVNVVSTIRQNHPNVPDEMYHLRDRLYKQFSRDLSEFKRLAKYLEEHWIPLSDEYDEGIKDKY